MEFRKENCMESPAQNATSVPTSVDDDIVTAARCALHDVRPFVGRIIPADVLDKAVLRGLVECAPNHRPRMGETGYRLTRRGWEKFRRLAPPVTK